MRIVFILLLPILLLTGCSDSESDMPIMDIVGIYKVGDEENINYANQFNRMPPLVEGDEVEILFDLAGNGNDLRSFIVITDNEKLKTILFFMADEISAEFSDADKGVLVFVDGVRETGLTVKIRITAPMDGEQPVSFHLSSKAVDSQGARVELKLPTKIYY